MYFVCIWDGVELNRYMSNWHDYVPTRYRLAIYRYRQLRRLTRNSLSSDRYGVLISCSMTKMQFAYDVYERFTCNTDFKERYDKSTVAQPGVPSVRCIFYLFSVHTNLSTEMLIVK